MTIHSKAPSVRSKYPKDWSAQDKRRFRVYGVTPEQYNELDTGYCPICLREWSDSVHPCIDHDHKTNRVRGVVCRFCNHYRIGRFTEPDIVDRISRYLRDALLLDYVMPPKKPRKRRKKRLNKK